MDFSVIQDKLKKDKILFLEVYSYAAVAIIIDKEKGLLIEKRNERLDDPWAGQFALPGGHFKKEDIDLLNTITREVQEETGIDLKSIKSMGYFGPFSPRNKLDLLVYVFVYILDKNNGNPELKQSSETSYLGWVTLDELKKGRKEMDGEIVFNIREGIIWGMSARILDTFMRMLEN